MEIHIYHYALCVSLTLMIFFSYRFIFGRLPEKSIYQPYRISRGLMGAALLNLSANYSIHFFFTPRLEDPVNAILLNLCTYWLAVWLFGSALMMLLNKNYVTRKRFLSHIAGWLLYCLTTHILWRYGSDNLPHMALPIILAVVFLTYAVRVARRVFITFRKATLMLDNYYSEDAAVYIRWMSVFTYWAIIFGVGQGVFTFVPDRFVYIWIISAIPFYIYLYVSYTNYLLFYEQVAGAINAEEEIVPQLDTEEQRQEEMETSNPANPSSRKMSKVQEQILEKKIEEWITNKEFTKGGITIEDMARNTGTNRTYISYFVNTRYSTSFRDWVNRLRLEYAKQLMKEKPELSITEVATQAGYLSLSYFIRTFKEYEGVTPGRWKKNN